MQKTIKKILFSSILFQNITGSFLTVSRIVDIAKFFSYMMRKSGRQGSNLQNQAF